MSVSVLSVNVRTTEGLPIFPLTLTLLKLGPQGKVKDYIRRSFYNHIFRHP